MKIANFILSLLFLLFAFVQYNDPDALNWILAYGLMAVLFGFGAVRKLNTNLLVFILIAFSAWTITFIPDFISWINLGAPSIAAEMKTEEPHIEFVREFLGLVICLVGILFLLWQTKKNRFK